MVVKHAVLGVAASLLLATAVLPAQAADDGYQDVFSSVVTAIGIMKDDPSPEIDYRERAPLVLPPRSDLPAPSVQAARPASWPTDPDVERRKKAAADARAPSENLLGNRNVLASKTELMSGRSEGGESSAIPDSSVRASRCGNNGNGRGCLVVSPDALRAESEHYEQSNPDTKRGEVEAGIEPDRVYLTQPPKGYLKTTKTVKVTNDGPKRYVDPSNPKSSLLYQPKDEDQ
jgi:hypothetical protein